MHSSSDDGAMDSLPPIDAHNLDRLSAREEQVLALAATGLIDKQIAVKLGVTLSTLRTYWTRIRAKVGEGSRSALVAVYVDKRATKRADEANWHIDLLRNVLVYYGERDHFPQGEMPMEEAIQRYHPEDAPRVRALLRAVEEPDMPSFTYIARVVTDHGLEMASAYVEIVRDESGRSIRLIGRHVPIVNLTSSALGESLYGSYRRDLITNRIVVDDGFCAIYRVRRDDPNLFQTSLSRLCPDYQESGRTAAASMIESKLRTLRRNFRLCFEGGTHLWVSSTMRLEYVGERPTIFTATIIAYQ